MRKSLLFLPFVLLSVNSFADGVITQNIANGCGADNLLFVDNVSYMSAIWHKNSYTCSPGYYLPANGIDCAECPADYTCNGGTYTFNETIDQGIVLNPIISHDWPNGCINLSDNSNMAAIWQRNTYDCGAGYYLPADGVECVLCPQNNYCPGEKYEYSENITQGAMECPSGLVAPMGGYDMGSCGRKIHIGDEILYLRSQKKTTPSLNVDINNDGIADFFGNATTQRTHINSTSSHYLHVGDYYIYDDTVIPEK